MPRPTNRDKALAALRTARSYDEGVTNTQLAAVCGFRYSARLKELRDRGFQISTEQVKGGLFRYRLTFDPEKDITNTQTQMEV